MPLGDDRGPIIRFVIQSAAYTGLISVRTWIAPLTLGIVRSADEVGLFRAAQMPQNGLAALSSPLRMILLSEQTRDWEHGRPEVVIAGIRRYVAGSAAIAALALVPVLLTIPWLSGILLGADYLPAVSAARLILVAAAIQLVFSWTKTFPVTIGRPGLRLIGARRRDRRDAPADHRASARSGASPAPARPCSSRRSRSRSPGA